MLQLKNLFFITLLSSTLNLLGQTGELDSLRLVWESPQNIESARVQAFTELMLIYGNRRESQKAADLSRQMLNQGISTENIYTQATAWQWLGWSYRFSGPEKKDSILICYYKSLELRRITKNDSFIAIGLSWTGNYLINLTDLKTADLFLSEALKIYLRHADSVNLADTYLAIGYLNYLNGNFRKALINLYKARKLKELLKDNIGAGTIVKEIGKTYWRLGDLNRASSFGKKALTYFKDEEIEQEYLATLDFIYMLEGKKGNYNVAIKGLTEVIQMGDTLDLKFNFYHGKLNRAESYIGLGHYDLAINDLLQVVTYCESFNSGQMLQATLGTLATAYYKDGQLFNSKNVSNRILKMQEATGRQRPVVETSFALKNLYMVHKDLGNHKIALDYFERFVSFQDSLSSESANRELANQEYKYKFENDSLKVYADTQQDLAKQQASLVFLEKNQNRILIISGVLFTIILTGGAIYFLSQRKKKAQREAAEARLKQQLEENRLKAIRAQFKPHFLANVQIAIQNYMDQGNARKASEYLDSYSGMMRNVLESSDKDTITIQKEITTVKQYMELYKLLLTHPFTYEIRIAESIDPRSQPIPSLVLQPIIENAIRHGITPLPGPGKILVEMEKVDDNLIIRIEDNGVGRSNASHEGNGTTSFGQRFVTEQLELVATRTGQKSHFEIVDMVDELNQPLGTRVILTIPIAS